jgi:hypothetical protein
VPSSPDWDEAYLAAMADDEDPGDLEEDQDPDNAAPAGLDDAELAALLAEAREVAADQARAAEATDAGAATYPGCARRTTSVHNGRCAESIRTRASSMTLKIPQRHSHPGDLVVGRGAVAATIGRDHAADRGHALDGDHVTGPGFSPGLASSR